VLPGWTRVNWRELEESWKKVEFVNGARYACSCERGEIQWPEAKSSSKSLQFTTSATHYTEACELWKELLLSLDTTMCERHQCLRWPGFGQPLLVTCTSWFSLGRQQFRSFVLQFCKQRGCSALTTKANDTGISGMVEQHWLDRFLKRNPTMAICKAVSQAITS